LNYSVGIRDISITPCYFLYEDILVRQAGKSKTKSQNSKQIRISENKYSK